MASLFWNARHSQHERVRRRRRQSFLISAVDESTYAYKQVSWCAHSELGPGSAPVERIKFKDGGGGITHRFRVQCHTLLKSSAVSPCPKGSEQYRTSSRSALCLTDPMLKNGELYWPQFSELRVFKSQLPPHPPDALPRKMDNTKWPQQARSNSVRVYSSALFAGSDWDWLRRRCQDKWSNRTHGASCRPGAFPLLLNSVQRRSELSPCYSIIRVAVPQTLCGRCQAITNFQDYWQQGLCISPHREGEIFSHRFFPYKVLVGNDVLLKTISKFETSNFSEWAQWDTKVPKSFSECYAFQLNFKVAVIND